eukprot:TRINITY_DN20452_c0_g1_i1.p1 TRINITY_DN20452_c0_g1~~TRINITY_DN20452_c0_g1_i1.p1  ORF type:complete len:463 (+),score=49.78 TRINITY_DN20452_c0_g1_i1:554-1942(+)
MLWNTRSWISNKIARLPGPILITEWSPDDAKILLGCSPGTLLLVDIAQRKPSCIVHGDNLLLGQPCSGIQPLKTPSGTCIVLEGMESMVRVFDPVKRVYLRTMLVNASNVTSKVNTASLPKITVKHLAGAPSGQHMVTYEESDVQINGRFTSTLRFWNLSGDTLEWKVNTYIDSPHGDLPVTGLATHKTRDIIISTASDGSVKKWKFSNDHWMHHSALKLNCKKSNGCSVSNDGTVIAVATDNSVSCLSTAGLADLGVLTQHVADAEIEHVIFPLYSQGKEGIIAHCKTHFFGWDLGARTLEFSVELPVNAIATCDSGYLVASNCTLLRFTSPTPVPSHSVSLLTSPTALLSLPTVTAFVDTTGFLKYLSHSESSQLFDLNPVDETPVPVAQEPPSILPAASLFKLHQKADQKSPTAGPLPCFMDPIMSCSALSEYYQGMTYTLQAPSVALNPILDSLFTYE